MGSALLEFLYLRTEIHVPQGKVQILASSGIYPTLESNDNRMYSTCKYAYAVPRMLVHEQCDKDYHHIQHDPQYDDDHKCNKYAMTRNWTDQNPNPTLKTKTGITKITNSPITKRRYVQPSGQLFPKRWPLSNPSRTKIILTNIR